jgi:hypothetical protein
LYGKRVCNFNLSKGEVLGAKCAMEARGIEDCGLLIDDYKQIMMPERTTGAFTIKIFQFVR